MAYLSLGEKRVLSFIHNRILFSSNVIDKFSLVVYIWLPVFPRQLRIQLQIHCELVISDSGFLDVHGVFLARDLSSWKNRWAFSSQASLFNTSALKHEDLSTKNLHLEYFSICITKENLTRKKLPYNEELKNSILSFINIFYCYIIYLVKLFGVFAGYCGTLGK